MKLFTSESVTPGHPDKVCDQISDAILDALLTVDAGARVAVETMATAHGLTIAGEVGSAASVDYELIARGVLERIGWTAANGLDPQMVPVRVEVVAQSPEICAAVGRSLELRASAATSALDELGAGDQGMMFGYAEAGTDSLMPLPIMLAHALAQRLTLMRATAGWLRPDGKTQVTVGYVDGVPVGVQTIVVSAQHDPETSIEELREFILTEVVEPVLLEADVPLLDGGRVLVNPSGSFVLGGPAVDAGLTGRKIIVDTYGGYARHGGGAFSGKDPSKVDRSGAYAARWAAKSVVSAGWASRCEIQLAYAIGSAHPVGVYLDTFGTGVLDDSALSRLLEQHFDFRPQAIIDALQLRRPIYLATSTFGHFGKPGLPWEIPRELPALTDPLEADLPARA